MKYPVNKPLLNGNELQYVTDCIKTGWISSGGKYVEKFEKKIAETFNRKFAVSVTSGTSALDISIEALNLNEGDEIVLPSFTIISCLNGIIRNKLKPIFIDSNLDDWNMDVKSIKRYITPKTKAIIIVHIYGLPVNLNPILDLAKEYNLKVIEDAAEVIGQTYYEKPCGSFGDISTLSFYANKHITTGEGGMILTDNEKLFNKCCSLRNLGFNTERRFLHYEIGYNSRMTNLQAAIGLAQLEKLQSKIKIKRKIGRLYQENLEGQPGIILPLHKTGYAENIYWVFGVLLDEKIEKKYDQIIQLLSKNNIETRPFFWPLHLQPVLSDYEINISNEESLNNSVLLAKRGFYLPSGLGLTKKEVIEICEIFKTILNRFIK